MTTTTTMTSASPGDSPDPANRQLSRTSGNTQSQIKPGFHSIEGFKFLKEIATHFANSHVVPILFKANPANALIACELASRIGASPLAVMQNMYIVHGKPGWSGKFLTSLWNSCGRFTPIRYEWSNENGKTCTAYSTELSTGLRLHASVNLMMAKGEGWLGRTDSKWKTMPEQMFMYRSASFLVNAFAPELTLGMSTSEELEDVYGGSATPAIPENFAEANTVAKSIEVSPGPAGPAATAGDSATADDSEILDAEVSSIMDSAGVTGTTETTAATQIPDVKPEAVESAPAVTAEPASATTQQSTASAEAETTISQTSQSDSPQVDRETLGQIAAILKVVNPPREVWSGLLNKLGVEKASLLSQQDAGRVIGWLEKKKQQIEMETWSQHITGNGSAPHQGNEVAASAASFSQ